MRLFAGPNGSGKSILKQYLSPALLGTYLNPDEIEKTIRREKGLNLRNLGIEADATEVLESFTRSTFLNSQGLAETSARLKYSGGVLDFSHVEVNAYFASVAVDFIRKQLLAQKRNFTFESVMSHPSKIELLKTAREAGYRTYLYYIATDDPEINISRVHSRVELGGHSVPEDKIVSRYYRSLDLLIDAIQTSDRAYIFDNSTESPNGDHTWLAEITDGRTLELKVNLIPAWFKKAVLDKTK